MIKKTFYFFVITFFLIINYSASTVKTAFVERGLFFLLFASLFFLFRYLDLQRTFLILTSVLSPLIFTYGIVQKYILFPIYLDSMDSGISAVSAAMRERILSGRIFSIFSLPTLYTFICAVLILAIFHYLINSKKPGSVFFWSVLFLGGVFNLILTQSFAGVLYLLTGLPLYLVLSGRTRLKYLIPLLMTLSVFLFIIAGLRFSEAKKLEPVKLRISNWNQSVRMIGESPLTGVGLGNYEFNVSRYIHSGEANSIYAHNFFLQITAETGLISMFPFLFILILFRKKIIPRFSRENAVYLSILAIVLLYNLIDIGFYFFSAALIFSLVSAQIYKKPPAPVPRITVLITLLLLIPQIIIFASDSIRRSGSFHLNFNRMRTAEGYFLKSLHYNKYNYMALMGLAKTAYASGNIAGAETSLDKVLHLNAMIPYAHFLKSRILYAKDMYLSSYFHAGKALSLNRGNGEYYKWYEFIRMNMTKNLKGPNTRGAAE